MKADIRSLSREELEGQFLDWGQPAYRVDQLLDWLYHHRVTQWEAMTNLPKHLRDQLQQEYALHALELVGRQGEPESTQKFLWRLQDLALIESVLIPANPALYGEPSDRHTLCISTQVGCAYHCQFCASGLAGWKRDLNPEEMIEQVLAVERWHRLANGERPTADFKPLTGEDLPSASGQLVNNLVVMGMGEPLANYEALMKALLILNAPWGGGIGSRKITVSTSGLAPQIRRLAHEPQQFRLAVSLHGATDEVRNRLMPVNRKYPLAELIPACEYYVSKKGKMISLEYILIEGINDSLNQVKPLAELAHRLHAKVNLIPYNHVENLPLQRPSEPVQRAFLAALKNRKVSATLRQEKGHDIEAACGQLRLKTERLEAAPTT